MFLVSNTFERSAMSEVNPPVDPQNPPAPPADPNPPAPPADMVPREEFERVKNDMHKYKTTAQEKERQLEEQRMNTLKEKQDWKSIAEANEQKAEEFRTKYEGLNKSLIDNAKHSAIKQAALSAGILAQSLPDLELLDFSEIHVETTSGGKILVSGADQAIQGLMKRRPHWFGSKPASVNPASPELHSPETSGMTLEKLKLLEKDYQSDPGNPAKKQNYFNGIMQFKKQNPG